MNRYRSSISEKKAKDSALVLKSYFIYSEKRYRKTMASLFVLTLLLLNLSVSFAQGTIRGNISDETGEMLTGATIILKNNNTVATITDFDGNYSLRIPQSGSQLIQISFIGYQTIEETVDIEAGKVSIYNYVLPIAKTEIDEAVIIGKANRSKDSYMRDVKMKSVTSLDYISKETIKRTGDSQVGDAIKRVTGVSTVQGFITVRGLADRYVKTTMNGSRIPTLDPLTNNIKLDIFPTSLIDNIVITKTQSPDLPADWSGAYISIETKDYPQQFMLNIKTSVGFNTQTTFKNVVSSQKSPTDWLGYDNGFRNIDHSTYSDYSETLNQYQVLTGNGMEPYLNSLGVDASHFDRTNMPYYQNPYYVLSLIEMGLLPPAYYYNQPDIEDANEPLLTNNSLYNNAFIVTNTPAADFGQSLPNSWEAIERKAPLMFSQEFNIGDQLSLFGRPLGLLLGFRYASVTKSDPNSHYVGMVYNSTSGFGMDKDMIRNTTIETNEWSVLVSTAYKINPNHSISLLFMPNIMGTNKARVDSGYSQGASDSHGFPYVINHNQQYEERKQMIYQFQTNHFFPAIQLKMDFSGGYTDGLSSQPDYKTDYSFGGGEVDSVGNPLYRFGQFDPTRRFTYLDENVLDLRLNAEIPIFDKPGIVRKIKVGGAYMNNFRETGQYSYTANAGSINASQTFSNPFSFTDLSRFALSTNSQGDPAINSYYYSYTNDFLFNIGYSNVSSAYAMVDYEFNHLFRISGGLRLEYTDLFNDVKKFYELGLPDDDPGRAFTGNVGPSDPKTPYSKANPTHIQTTDLLPSVNLIFRMLSNEKITFNSRISYSETLARPSIREVSPLWTWDLDLQAYVFGNPELKPTSIDNFDFKLEAYFQSGDFVSAGVFNKVFVNHIEMSYDGGYTWTNGEKGYARGIEFEGKKKLIDNFSLAVNLTLVSSNTKVQFYTDDGLPDGIIDRAMFGQAPYIVNALLDYNNAKLGIMAAISYNVQGPKIALATSTSDYPDVYEMPVHRLDLKLGKSLGKHFTFEFRMRNVLNQPTRRAYYYEGNYDLTYDSYNFGTDYIFSLAYDF